jgi:hypothetical protein
MSRLTIYDPLARCYKMKPDAVGNAIQTLGKHEDVIEEINTQLHNYDYDCTDADNALDEISELLKEKELHYED